VVGDLFDDFGGFGFGVAVGRGFGKVEAGDLEAVEEQAGAAGVDVVGGDAAENFADGVLDGGAVFGKRKVEGGAAASALLRVGDGFSGGVVVVAEVFSAQAGAAAAVAVGEDAAALEAFGDWCGVLHGWALSPVKVCKVFQRKDLRPDFRVQVWFKCEGPAWWPGLFFSYYFYSNELSETKMPSLADLFFACKRLRLFGVSILIFEFGCFQDLTCDFWAKIANKR
jgi:hypothetical protein